ncbi:MAG: vWA domain-containing protein [Planctomycetia bacterium]|nr:vWA domain-containing protein [Planctomycetia bacterium]
MPDRINGGATADSKSPVSWRGRLAARARVVRHRWQKDWTAQPLEHLQTQEHWRRIRTLILLVAALGLTAALVNRLLFAPQLTPLIGVATTDYSWPVTPQGWAQEDQAAIAASLHGQNLWAADISADWRTREAGLRSLDQQLETLSADAKRAQALILYFSMPGVVDGNGAPCLIPPGASPLDSSSWLPLSEIIAHVRARNLPRSCRVLIVLDAARADVDWKLGTLENAFVAGLESVWRDANLPNLTILNSAARGQRSWTSNELQGSVFGHFFRLGMTGEADVLAGNDDRQVTLSELTSYLEQEVNAWTRFNRGAEQRPTLIPSGAADAHLVWALKPSTRKRLVDAAATAQAPVVTDADLAALWSARERLRDAKLISLDGNAWHRLEHDLLVLEQQIRGGAAYRESARALAGTLKKRLATWESEIATSSRWRVQTGESAWPVETRLHSLAEALRTSGADQGEIKRQLNALQRFVASPTLQSFQATATELMPLAAPVANEAQLFNILARSETSTWWQQPQMVADVLRQQITAAELAAPNDPRTNVWAAAGLAVGDRARRAAIDQLLIGDDTSLAESTLQASQAQAAYAAAAEWTALSKDAFELCDETLAELPYLAEWLAQPQPSAVIVTRHDRLINETLLPLIEDVQELSALLAVGEAGTAQAPTDAAVLKTRVAELRARREQLREPFLKQARDVLAAKAPSGRALRAMQSLLATPILPASLRDELWRASGKVSAALQRRYVQDPRPEMPAVEPGQYHERVTSRWTRHPLAALLNLNGAAAGASSDPIALGQQARLRAARLPEQARSALATGGDVAENVALASAGGDVTPRRDGWSSWEFSLRAALPLLAARDEDVLLLVRRLDLQAIQLANARRTLDDFFGPASAGEAPFFEVAAQDYLTNARKLATPGSMAQAQIESLTSLVDARRLAAREAMSATAADLLVVDPSEQLDITVAVAENAAAAKGLPEGTPGVWVRDQSGRLPIGAAASFSAEPVKFTLPATELATRGPALDAVISLRGNERGAAFLLRPPVGGAVDFAWRRYGPPRVVVQGRRRQPASIMFVLDASYSMRDPIPGVESAGQATEIPRIDAAKDALRRMMTQLALAGDARVGVRVFGHRVGWTTTEPTQILPQPNYARPYPADLTPAEDVELILPLGRFDDSVGAEVEDILQQVQPWGQSPLYLALRQALDDFSGENPDAERRIVVVTDGANYQFNALQPTTREDVMSLAAARRIPVHIVGFGIPTGELAAAENDFQAIAEQTGGSYVTVENATSLIASLEELLGPTEYRVTGPDDELFGPARVGTQVAISPSPTSPTAYTVTAAGAEENLELSGGEAVEMQLDRGGRALLVVPYEIEDAVTTPLMAGANEVATETQFVGHRALRNEETVKFTFSLQSEDRAFVPRPEELWIELSPLAADGRRLPGTYYLYDSNYLPETTCPVVSWQALGWPAESRSAQARIWCRQQATSTDLVIANLGDPSHQVGTTHRLPGRNSIDCQLRVRMGSAAGAPAKVSLVERHAADSPGLGALKVQMVPPPLRVTHRWDEQHGLVVHVFELDTRARGLDGYQLHLTRFEKLANEAWHSREPLTIDIGASDNLLRLEPTSP